MHIIFNLIFVIVLIAILYITVFGWDSSNKKEEAPGEE